MKTEIKVIGRQIFEGEKLIGRIVGDRPHINDLWKGYRCSFAIIWDNEERTDMSNYGYFKDVVRAVKVNGRKC